MEKHVEYATKVFGQIHQMVNDPECENYINPEDFDENMTHESSRNLKAFFHALSTMAPMAPGVLYEHFTGDKKDSIEFNHLMNRICFEFVNIE